MGDDPERIWGRLQKLPKKLQEKVWKGRDITLWYFWKTKVQRQELSEDKKRHRY